MRRTSFRIIVLGLLLCMLMVNFTQTVAAEPNLQWHTNYVYYDTQGRLVIEGYFANNGTRIITRVNWLDLKVYFRRWYSNWWLQAESTFKDLEVNLLPGEISKWTLRIIDAEYTLFDYYDIVGTVDYNYM